MFDNNGHGPILSETEIKFLLSDLFYFDSPARHPEPDKSKPTSEGTKKEEIVDNLFATRREPR